MASWGSSKAQLQGWVANAVLGVCTRRELTGLSEHNPKARSFYDAAGSWTGHSMCLDRVNQYVCIQCPFGHDTMYVEPAGKAFRHETSCIGLWKPAVAFALYTRENETFLLDWSPLQGYRIRVRTHAH